MRKRKIIVSILVLSLGLVAISMDQNTLRAYAAEENGDFQSSRLTNFRNREEKDHSVSDDGEHLSGATEIGKKIFRGVDNDVTTNDKVDTDVNIPVDVKGNTHNEYEGSNVDNSTSKSNNYSKGYTDNTTRNYTSNYYINETNNNGSSKNSSKDSTSTSKRESDEVSSETNTVSRTIEDMLTPLGNDYLSEEWQEVGYVPATCDTDGYVTYYNSETGEITQVIEKSAGHHYTSEKIKGNVLEPSITRTYCKDCGEIICETESKGNYSLAGVLGAIATLCGAVIYKKK